MVATENPQDVGGQAAWDSDLSLPEVIEASDKKPYQYWQFQTHALAYLLASKKIWTTAGMRSKIEGLPKKSLQLSYYEIWALAIAAVCVEKGLISQSELDQALGVETDAKPEVTYV